MDPLKNSEPTDIKLGDFALFISEAGGNESKLSRFLLTLKSACRTHRNAKSEEVALWVTDFFLRHSIETCKLAGTFVRDLFEDSLVDSIRLLEVLEKWERAPVTGFDPNLGATVYEHIIQNPQLKNRFGEWKKDKILRQRYIEVAFALPLKEELSVYDWAISIGELEAARSSVVTFLNVKRIPPEQERHWKEIRKALNV